MSVTAKSAKSLLLIAPAALLLGIFLILPYLNILLMSFRNPGNGAPYAPVLPPATICAFCRTASI